MSEETLETKHGLAFILDEGVSDNYLIAKSVEDLSCFLRCFNIKGLDIQEAVDNIIYKCDSESKTIRLDCQDDSGSVDVVEFSPVIVVYFLDFLRSINETHKNTIDVINFLKTTLNNNN